MGGMSAKMEAIAAREAPKLRALLEANGYVVRKCQPIDCGAQIGTIVFVNTPEDGENGQEQAETEAAS